MPLCEAPCNVNLTGAMMDSPHPGIANSVLMFDTVQTKYDLNDRLHPPTLRRTITNMSFFVAVNLIIVGILGLMHHPLARGGDYEGQGDAVFKQFSV